MMGTCRSFGFRRSMLLLAIWVASQTVFAQDVEIATSVAFTEGPAVDSEAMSISPTLLTNES
jgi:hypothetical protein